MNIVARSLYERFVSASSRLRTPFLLVVRLYWGWLFARTGLGKVMNIDRVVGFFTSLDIPMPVVTAHFVGWLELVGGILLILGLFSRPIAFVLTTNMLFALWFAHHDQLVQVLADPSKFMDAAPFTFLVASLIVWICGPGKWGVDTLLKLENGIDRK